jgi:hypothetical protein
MKRFQYYLEIMIRSTFPGSIVTIPGSFGNIDSPNISRCYMKVLETFPINSK